MELDRATMKKLVFLIVLAVALLACAQNLGAVAAGLSFLLGILSPFLTGATVAFILNVPMRFLEDKLLRRVKVLRRRRRLLRPLALLLTMVLVLLVVMLVLLVVIPQLAESVAGLGETIRAFVPRVIGWAEELFASNPQIVEWLNSLTFDWQEIIGDVVDWLRTGAGDVLSSTISAAMTVVSGIASFFISFIFACYILLQKESLGRQCRKALYALLPRPRADRALEVARLSGRVFSSFITGQCIEAVILGGMFFVVLSLVGLPYALLIGCLIAVTALIPIVGAFIGCAIGAFLLLMVSPAKALLFVILFLVLQQIEGNLIYPHVVGSSVGLPSIWVLAAVTIGGNLMGVTGMLLFIPLTSVAYALFRDFVNRRLAERRIRVK